MVDLGRTIKTCLTAFQREQFRHDLFRGHHAAQIVLVMPESLLLIWGGGCGSVSDNDARVVTMEGIDKCLAYTDVCRDASQHQGIDVEGFENRFQVRCPEGTITWFLYEYVLGPEIKFRVDTG